MIWQFGMAVWMSRDKALAKGIHSDVQINKEVNKEGRL